MIGLKIIKIILFRPFHLYGRLTKRIFVFYYYLNFVLYAEPNCSINVYENGETHL